MKKWAIKISESVKFVHKQTLSVLLVTEQWKPKEKYTEMNLI